MIKKMTKQRRYNTIWFNKKANIQFVKIGQVKRYSEVNIPKTYKQRTHIQFEVSINYTIQFEALTYADTI